MWIPHFVQRNAIIRPHQLALRDAARRLTWLELDERTDALATALAELGVKRGDRIVVLSGNRVEVVELCIAVTKAGAMFCPVNPGHAIPELEYIASNIRPVGVFGEQRVLVALGGRLAGWTVEIGEQRYEAMAHGSRRKLALPAPGDAAVIFSTSATTGRPKAVVMAHRSIMACYLGMAAETGMSSLDVMLNPCPLFHGSMVIGLALLAAGGQLVIERDFTPQRFLTDVEAVRATRTFLTPSMLRFVLAAKAFSDTDLSSLREVMHGGGPIAEDVMLEAVARFPCRLRSVYGITEGGGPIALGTSDEPPLVPGAPGSPGSPGVNTPLAAGRMMPGAQIAVLDEAGNPMPSGEVGEICVQGDGVMDRYWENDEATRSALMGGWLRTGDLGYLDAAGYVYLLDRKNDLIIRGGQNVYPAEIERVIRALPGVIDVAAVGVPSRDWGEVPVVFVVLAEDARLRTVDLIAACSAELASYKRPVAVHIAPEIPRNAAGKILRRVLREWLAAGPQRQLPRGVPATGGI
jgi:acyl-CoA synthetase (AMP-forming)/AMP-acid ligase II